MAARGKVVSISAPGKSRVIFDIKCIKCSKVVRNGILCDVCDKWNHFRCAKVQEDNLPKDEVQWKCPHCSLNTDVSAAATSDSELETLKVIVKILENDMEILKKENEELKRNSVLKIEQSNISDQCHRPNLTNDPVTRRGWETQGARKSSSTVNNSKTNLMIDYKNFPVLRNRFEVLTDLGSDNVIRPTREGIGLTSGEHQILFEERNGKRPKANEGRSRPKALSTKPNQKPKPMNIKFYSDSQGRGIWKQCMQDGVHCFSGTVKPGARFQEVVQDSTSSEGNNDVIVLLAGTNDIGKNEKKGLLSSLRRKLFALRASRKVIVFSVPHRYDLPDWSIVNKEVEKANEDMAKICKRFSNVSFVDISRLGKRFHTRQGLHLNSLGKQFVSSIILDVVDSISLKNEETELQPIPLGFLG